MIKFCKLRFRVNLYNYICQLIVPFMADNHPDDKYLYEIVVETGPMATHATSSKINFILSGEDEETDVR